MKIVIYAALCEMSIFISYCLLCYIFAKSMEHVFSYMDTCRITQAIISRDEQSCNSAVLRKSDLHVVSRLNFQKLL